jgi:pseudouridine synthase
MSETSVRLNRYLSMCGAASRRQADQLIAGGRVQVNGQPALRLGTVVDINNDTVKVDGRGIRPPRRCGYFVFHKPTGCLCSRGDPQGRRTIYDLLPPELRKLKYVGRLDQDTEGLLLLTDDGGLIEYLTHPRNQIPRTYRAEVRGLMQEADLEPLRRGIEYEGETYRPAQARILAADRPRNRTRLEITIREGKKREVRMMLRALGLQVERLTRTAFGPLRLERLPQGDCRACRPDEMAQLRKMAPASSQ